MEHDARITLETVVEGETPEAAKETLRILCEVLERELPMTYRCGRYFRVVSSGIDPLPRTDKIFHIMDLKEDD